MYLELLQQQLPESVAVYGAPNHLNVPDVLAQNIPPSVQLSGVKTVNRRAPHGGTTLVEQLPQTNK